MSSEMPEDLRDELEEIKRSLDSEEDSGSTEYRREISKTAWMIVKETDYDYGHSRIEELVFNYSETFNRFYEENPSNAVDYLERFDGDINQAIESLKKGRK